MKQGYIFSPSSIYADRNVRSLVVRILNALKCFYTFKDLEELLGISQQVLWRYVNFLTIPEEVTARRILSRIEELGLVEKIIKSTVKIKNGNVVERWRMYNNVGFLDILSFYVLSMDRIDDVDTVLGFPESSAPVATAVAQWLRTYLCVAMRRVAADPESKYLTEVYESKVTGTIEYLAVPKGCIDKGDLVLLVTDVLEDVNLLNATLRLVRRSLAEPWGLVAAVAKKDAVLEASRYGIKHIKVLELIE